MLRQFTLDAGQGLSPSFFFLGLLCFLNGEVDCERHLEDRIKCDCNL